jgi:hypothetical protein
MPKTEELPYPRRIFVDAAPVQNNFFLKGYPMLKPTPKKTSAVPAHLSGATREWFANVATEYELEPHHSRLLQLAAESWDRCQDARAVLDRDGISYTDRFGAPRARPEVAVERDSRLSFARLIRELDLDIEAPSSTPRPPGLRSNRRS